MTLDFRQFTAADILIFASICKDAFDADSQLHLGENGGPSGYDNGDYLSRHFLNPDTVSFAIFDDGKAIAGACVKFDGHTAELESLFVKSDAENQGYGLQIWQFIEKKFPDVQLWKVATPAYSVRNHHFYVKKCGFQKVMMCDNTCYFEKNKRTECIGCAIASKKVVPTGGLIKETSNFILHQDPEIPIKNFLIITSKKHIHSIAELSKEENTELSYLAYQTRTALLSFADIINCRLIQEERSEHFHLWLSPRYHWMDEKFDDTLTSVRSIMDYAKENFKSEDSLNEILMATEELRELLKR